MNQAQNKSAVKLIEKFDTQLLDILAAELRSVRYAKNKIIEHIALRLNNGLLPAS